MNDGCKRIKARYHIADQKYEKEKKVFTSTVVEVIVVTAGTEIWWQFFVTIQ